MSNMVHEYLDRYVTRAYSYGIPSAVCGDPGMAVPGRPVGGSADRERPRSMVCAAGGEAADRARTAGSGWSGAVDSPKRVTRDIQTPL